MWRSALIHALTEAGETRNSFDNVFKILFDLSDSFGEIIIIPPMQLERYSYRGSFKDR